MWSRIMADVQPEKMNEYVLEFSEERETSADDECEKMYDILSDTLLSETRFVRKYVVVKDEQLYKNYRLDYDEFNSLMRKGKAHEVYIVEFVVQL